MPNHIQIAGLTACGKTTHSRILSGELGWDRFSASEALLFITKKSNSYKADFWLTEEAKEIEIARNLDIKIDRLVDKMLVDKICENRPVIIESFGAPWITDAPGLRIWIDSDITSRVYKAIVSFMRGYSELQYEDSTKIEKELLRKDEFIRDYFRNEYKVDIFSDYEIFDLIIDTSDLISSPTIESSNLSIRHSQNIISAAVNAYIWDLPILQEEWRSCYQANSSRIRISPSSKLFVS